MDYRAHETTYTGFIHLLKWFAIHLGLLLVGLYFLVMQGNATGGTLFTLLAVGAIAYSVISIGRTTSKVAGHPENWHGLGQQRDQSTERNC